MAVASDAGTEQHAITRYLLHRRELFGDPCDGPERDDHDPETELHAVGGAGNGRQGNHAVEERGAGAGDELIDNPHRFEPEFFRVASRSDDVAGLSVRRVIVGRKMPIRGFATLDLSLPRQTAAQVDSLVRSTDLGEQMKSFNVYESWEKGDRGLKP